jgi:hypothetical protein
VRVFRNTWFTRWAAKESISDKELKDAAAQIEAGQFDADLGGRVYKQRIARSGAGKSGGYRVVVFFKLGKRAFFVYGFAKSKMANISEKELRAFKESAGINLNLDDKQLEMRIKARQWVEI